MGQQDGEQGRLLAGRLAAAVGEEEPVIDADAEDKAQRQHAKEGERLSTEAKQRQPHGDGQPVDQQDAQGQVPADAMPEQPHHQHHRDQQQLGELEAVIGKELAPLAALILPDHPVMLVGQTGQCGGIVNAGKRHPNPDPAIGQGVPEQTTSFADRAG